MSSDNSVSKRSNFEEKEVRAPSSGRSNSPPSAQQRREMTKGNGTHNGGTPYRSTPTKSTQIDDPGRTSPPNYRGEFSRKEHRTPVNRHTQKRNYTSMVNLGHGEMNVNATKTLEIDSMFKDSFALLHEFQQRKEMCDLELTVGSRSFLCHRVVLCCVSRYFRSMFTSQMKTSGMRVVDLKDLDPKSVDSLIQYAYTARISITGDTVQPLLFASSFLQIETVSLACSGFMKQHLEPKNCIDMRKFAEQHGRTDLQQLADSYMCDHFMEITECDEFTGISPQNLADVISNEDLNVDSETQVYEAVIRWVRHDPDNRKQTLAPLLSKVKLPLLPASYLTQVVEAEDLIRKDMECRDYLDEAKSYQLSLAGLTPGQRPYDRMVPRRSCSGVLFCVGGRGASGDPFRSIECFDFRNDRWFQIAEMSTRRRHVGVVSADGKLYAIGGHDGTEHLNNAEVFDPVTNRWSYISPMRTLRRGLAVAAMSGALYAIGGLDDSTCFDLVERYDPVDDMWSMIAPMNVARGGVGVAVLKNCVYAVGGNDGASSLSSCERYDPILNKWVMICPMNKRRAGAGVAVLHGRLYAVGGFDDNAPLESAEVYDPDTNRWSYVMQMTCPRGGVGVASLGGHLFAVGGHDGTNYLNSVEAYNPLSDSWEHHSALLVCRAGSGITSGLFHVAAQTKLQRLKSHYQSAGAL